MCCQARQDSQKTVLPSSNEEPQKQRISSSRLLSWAGELACEGDRERDWEGPADTSLALPALFDDREALLTLGAVLPPRRVFFLAGSVSVSESWALLRDAIGSGEERIWFDGWDLGNGDW